MEVYTDYYRTGRLYNKLDAYMLFNNELLYIGSSCHFATQKAYKLWLYSRNIEGCIGTDLKIKRGEA